MNPGLSRRNWYQLGEFRFQFFASLEWLVHERDQIPKTEDLMFNVPAEWAFISERKAPPGERIWYRATGWSRFRSITIRQTRAAFQPMVSIASS